MRRASARPSEGTLTLAVLRTVRLSGEKAPLPTSLCCHDQTTRTRRDRSSHLAQQMLGAVVLRVLWRAHGRRRQLRRRGDSDSVRPHRRRRSRRHARLLGDRSRLRECSALLLIIIEHRVEVREVVELEKSLPPLQQHGRRRHSLLCQQTQHACQEVCAKTRVSDRGRKKEAAHRPQWADSAADTLRAETRTAAAAAAQRHPSEAALHDVFGFTSILASSFDRCDVRRSIGLSKQLWVNFPERIRRCAGRCRHARLR
jgi:hypothetical protein